MICVGHAEHLGEHAHRQRRGDVGDEVHLALVEGVVESTRSKSSRIRSVKVRTARGVKSLVDDRAQLVVARRIHVDHRLARLDLIGIEILERGPAALGGEGAPVLGHRGDVGVGGDRPEAATVSLFLPVHRVLAAKQREHLVGNAVGEAGVVGEIDVCEGQPADRLVDVDRRAHQR